jgi:hypothetical protein
MKPLSPPRAPLRRRGRRSPAAVAVEQAAPVAAPRTAPTPEQRARAAGGPEDRALYLCGCGAAFRADVQVDVPCPACGAAQSW